MSFQEISRRRRYVCSAHPWPFPPSPRTSSLFAIIAHPWRRRPRRRGRSQLPTRHIIRTATAPSPSRQFPASNTAYHPHSDGEAPSLRLLRTPVASSPSSHTSSLFAIIAHPWRRRPRRRGRSQLPTRHIIRTATARRRRYLNMAYPDAGTSTIRGPALTSASET